MRTTPRKSNEFGFCTQTPGREMPAALISYCFFQLAKVPAIKYNHIYTLYMHDVPTCRTCTARQRKGRKKEIMREMAFRKIRKLGIIGILFMVGMVLFLQGAFAGEKQELQNPKVISDESMIAGQNTTWDTVYYGYYPQTEIVGATDQCGIKTRLWKSEKDYSLEPEVYAKLEKAKYTAQGDTVLDGIKYRRMKAGDRTYVSINSEINNHYLWTSGIKYHYFRYEPIRWRVLTVQDTSKGKRALLLADKILDDRKYNETEGGTTWEKSTLRSWLNGYGAQANQAGRDYSKDGFIKTAFREAQQTPIVTGELANKNNYAYGTNGGNDTADRIFLLSEDEMYMSSTAAYYGFVAAGNWENQDEGKRARGSTYSKAKGLWCNHEAGFEGNSMWWMRSPGQFERNAAFVCNKGFIRFYGTRADAKDVGIRPAMVLNMDDADWTYGGTVISKGGGTETAPPSMNVFGDEVLEYEEEEPEAPAKVMVSKISIAASPSLKIAAGKKATLKANVSPAKATDRSVTWTCSNTKYATVNSKGVVTTKSKGKGKTVTITVKAKDGSGKKCSVKVRIMKHSVKSVSLKGPKSIKRGKSGKIKAKIKTTGKDANRSLRYSSNSKYAKVTSSGKVSVQKKAKKNSTVKITAKALDGTNRAKTIKIRIK